MLEFTYLQIKNTDIAEDIVQEALVSALRNMNHSKRQAALKTCFFAILKNKIIDYIRQKDRWVLASKLASNDGENTFFDQSGHWKEQYSRVAWNENDEFIYSAQFLIIFEACLTHLPANQAQVFMIREYLEIPSKDICKMVNITTNNFHTLLYRAELQPQNCLSKKSQWRINNEMFTSYTAYFAIARTQTYHS